MSTVHQRPGSPLAQHDQPRKIIEKERFCFKMDHIAQANKEEGGTEAAALGSSERKEGIQDHEWCGGGCGCRSLGMRAREGRNRRGERNRGLRALL